MYNFGLSQDQLALQDAVRKFCDVECASDKVRSVIEQPAGFAAEQWRGLADLGIFGLALPEEFGGSDLGAFDLLIVLEALGRSVLPAPVIETLAVGMFIARSGSETIKARFLPAIATGSIATVAIDEAEHYWNPLAASASAELLPSGTYRLNGVKPWVAYGHVADLVLATVNVGGAVAVALLEAADIEGRTTLQDGIDDSYRIAELTLDGIEIAADRLLGVQEGASGALIEAWDLATVLASAELLGCMERSLELIVEYAKIRSQFGKLIGSYQALKHRCADMLIDLEATRGTVYFAAAALSGQGADRVVAVSSAKAAASDAAVRCAEKALQSFGAIGFTWEYDIHFYLKRAKRLEMTFGHAVHHREIIAQHL